MQWESVKHACRLGFIQRMAPLVCLWRLVLLVKLPPGVQLCPEMDNSRNTNRPILATNYGIRRCDVEVGLLSF